MTEAFRYLGAFIVFVVIARGTGFLIAWLERREARR